MVKRVSTLQQLLSRCSLSIWSILMLSYIALVVLWCRPIGWVMLPQSFINHVANAIFKASRPYPNFSCHLPYTIFAGDPDVAISPKSKVRRIDSKQHLANHFAIVWIDDCQSIWYGSPNVTAFVNLETIRQS